jgi:hypothetical protein
MLELERKKVLPNINFHKGNVKSTRVRRQWGQDLMTNKLSTLRKSGPHGASWNNELAS